MVIFFGFIYVMEEGLTLIIVIFEFFICFGIYWEIKLFF